MVFISGCYPASEPPRRTRITRTLPALATALALTLQGPTCGAMQTAATAHDKLVTAAMSLRYLARHTQARDCWLYMDQRYGRYCVKPLRSQWVERSGIRQLYLLTAGEPITADDRSEDLPAHALPGLVGAFALVATADGAPKFLAATDAFMYGSFGDSGASTARLIQIGAGDYYGWIFSSGGTWQGISVGWHHILAPHGRRFVDLSAIPTMRESDQDHRYTISYDRASSAGRVYPLTVTKLAQPRGAEVAHFLVPFNFRTWRYELPPAASVGGKL